MARRAPQRAVASALAAVGALGSLEGCVLSCNELGCNHSVSVEIRFDEATLVAGDYRFAFDALGDSHSCTIELPDDAQQLNQPCGAGQLSRAEPGAPLVLHMYDGPIPNVKVAVSRDDTDLGTATLWPNYHLVYPNGPDCPAACRVADVALRLPDGDGQVEVP